jgi:hypothetical protein
LLCSSAGLGWSTISAELRCHGVSETPVIVPQHVELILAVEGLVKQVADDPAVLESKTAKALRRFLLSVSLAISN